MKHTEEFVFIDKFDFVKINVIIYAIANFSPQR